MRARSLSAPNALPSGHRHVTSPHSGGETVTTAHPRVLDIGAALDQIAQAAQSLAPAAAPPASSPDLPDPIEMRGRRGPEGQRDDRRGSLSQLSDDSHRDPVQPPAAAVLDDPMETAGFGDDRLHVLDTGRSVDPEPGRGAPSAGRNPLEP